MKVSLINRENTKFSFNDDFILNKNLLAFAERVISISLSGYYFESYKILKNVKDSMVVAMHKKIFPESHEGCDAADRCLEDIKKANAKKHKTKHDLMAFQISKIMIERMRTDTMNYMKDSMQYYGLGGLERFIDEGIYDPIMFYQFDKKQQKEDSYIEIIIDLMENEKTIFLLDISVKDDEKIWVPESRDSALLPDELPMMIEIPMFTLPDLKTLNGEELFQLRLQFQKVFNPVNTGISQFIDSVKPDYTVENLSALQTWIFENIEPCLSNIRRETDSNLYLQNIYSKDDKATTIQYSLGITSATFLASLFQKQGLLAPFVAQTLKHHIEYKEFYNKAWLILLAQTNHSE